MRGEAREPTGQPVVVPYSSGATPDLPRKPLGPPRLSFDTRRMHVVVPFVARNRPLLAGAALGAACRSAPVNDRCPVSGPRSSSELPALRRPGRHEHEPSP